MRSSRHEQGIITVVFACQIGYDVACLVIERIYERLMLLT